MKLKEYRKMAEKARGKIGLTFFIFTTIIETKSAKLTMNPNKGAQMEIDLGKKITDVLLSQGFIFTRDGICTESGQELSLLDFLDFTAIAEILEEVFHIVMDNDDFRGLDKGKGWLENLKMIVGKKLFPKTSLEILWEDIQALNPSPFLLFS